MGWKDLSYWLRGGIILALIHILALVLLVYPLYLKNQSIPAQYEPWPATIIMVIPDYPAFIMAGIFFNIIGKIFDQITDYPPAFELFIIFLFGTLQWFIIGAILGWIYGKIKERKNN